jgi:hypothetical protein
MRASASPVSSPRSTASQPQQSQSQAVQSLAPLSQQLHTRNIQQHAAPSTTINAASSTASSSSNNQQQSLRSHTSSGGVGSTSIPSSTSASSSQLKLRIWIGSWNMAAKDVAENQYNHIGKFVPLQCPTTNQPYDLYIFSTQECVADTIYDLIERHLQQVKVHRLHSIAPKVEGRGDGSFLKQKHTGLVVYVHNSLRPYCHVLQSAACSLGITEGSKGGACCALKLYHTTISIVGVHMSSKSVLDRRHCFSSLVDQCGAALGDSEFSLLDQFHHCIWLGDTNMRLSAAQTSAPQILKLLTEWALVKCLTFDEMQQEQAAVRQR